MDTFQPLNSHVQSLTKSSPLYHLTNTKLSLLAETQGHNLDCTRLLWEPQPLLPLPPFILCMNALSKISVTSRHPFSILLHCPQDKSTLLSSSGLSSAAPANFSSETKQHTHLHILAHSASIA